MSLHHSFDINLASIYGIPEAIIIHHFQHWISINKRLGRNFKDGKTWTYQTHEEICAHFPYLSKEEVRETIERLATGKSRRSKSDELEFEPVLIKGNFNKTPFDKTTWYAFSNNSYERADAQIGSGHLPTPIPDTKTDTKKTPLPPKGEIVRVACGAFVKLSKEEFKELCEAHGTEIIKGLIEEINDYLAATGKKPYKDYAAVLRQWIRRRKDNPASSTKNSIKPTLNGRGCVDGILEGDHRSWANTIERRYHSDRIFSARPGDYAEFVLRDGKMFKIYYKDSKFKEIVVNSFRNRGIDIK